MSRKGSFNLAGWFSFALVLLAWELFARAAPEYRLYIPRVTEVVNALARALLTGAITSHLLATLQRFGTGYLVAAALGVGLGITLGYFLWLQPEGPTKETNSPGLIEQEIRPMAAVVAPPDCR